MQGRSHFNNPQHKFFPGEGTVNQNYGEGDQRNPSGEGNGILQAPHISLPKGGGAIRGIGEKFAANPVTGTGSMSVPIATSPGRTSFGPQLTLSYDSGAGNGPFGFGWSLNLPQITRKTDKGLPRYNDKEESDVFLLSGSEDLVPEFEKGAGGRWIMKDGKHVINEKLRNIENAQYQVRAYRPRIEGLFARIERWTNQADSRDVHWRSFSRDNILTIFGKDTNSRIADPADPKRIFTWLICETRDDKGNAIVYEYKPEDGAGVKLDQSHERNRGDHNSLNRTANRYLKSILYGNRVPLLDHEGRRPSFITPVQIQDAKWMFEVIFDFDENHLIFKQVGADQKATVEASTVPGKEWTFRKDPFSSYRAGYEIRTTRLCKRILMFHHFPGEEGVGNNCLVRSTDFTYSHEESPDDECNPKYTFLLAVTQSGYKHNKEDGYLKRSLPPVEFGYTKPEVQDKVEEVDPESLENLPIGVDGVSFQWTDLHGEGIPGILTEQVDAWFYKRNISPISKHPVEFAPLEQVAIKPSLELATGAQFMDLAGDGLPDLVMMDGFMPGLFEHDDKEGWQPFRPFTSRLNLNMRDPNLKFVDLDGDGHADILISETDVLVWHASHAEEGFGPAQRIAKVLDEEKGPRVVFSDGTQSIYLADLSGDGLTDLVRIRNGEVCYWPNLGYGRFGGQVTMDNAPQFDHPDQFTHSRIRLADIDGSGTTDIIYLHRDGVLLYFNQSGNSWSKPKVLSFFPPLDDLVSIVPTDLLGNGTACLVWSSPLPADGRRQMRYVNLMGSEKPHLLIRTCNNFGTETLVHYAPSTKFYLQDKYEGNPWITRLPFPVHVVEQVETIDHISGNRFVTRYAYHHGYFDGEEREFRGFGMVEQWDTETIAALSGNQANVEATNVDTTTNVPPVHTRTWFHTGIYLDRAHISRQFEKEYYREPGLNEQELRTLLLPDTILPAGLTLDEEREVCRALKGMMLRQEVYADDAPPGSSEEVMLRARRPFTVLEQNFTVSQLQPRAGNRHAVFFTHAREALTYHYERRLVPVLNHQIIDEAIAANNANVQWLHDPRVQHAMTLEVDAYGNVLKDAAIGYGRRYDSSDATLLPADREKQRLIQITFTENTFTNAITEEANTYRTPLPAKTSTYELRRPEQEKSSNGITNRYPFERMLGYINQSGDGNHGIAYEDFSFARAIQAVENDAEEGEKYYRRLIEQVITRYRHDDLSSLLLLGEMQSLALPGESYKLALTPSLLARVFKRKQAGQADEDLLPDSVQTKQLLKGKGADQGGYVMIDGNWWVPSGRIFFDPAADIDDPATTAAQELKAARQHFFLPRRITNPFGHSTVVDYDGHDLLVSLTRDALENTIAAANDYRVLQAKQITDPNKNHTEVLFDTLGMVVATAVMAKEGEKLGDLLEGVDADPPLSDLQAFVAAPKAKAALLLGKATSRTVYDLWRYHRTGQAPFAATLARETHFYDPGGEQSKIQVSFSYSDGFGREIQRKIQAEEGNAAKRQDPVSLESGDIRPGELVRNEQDKIKLGNTISRWVGTGRTVFNNKGNPVLQYEPFFSATHLYEDEKEMTDTGVSPILFYDPLGRPVATLHPNHTYEKVLFDPWQQKTFDVNDTVAKSGNETGNPPTDPDIKGYVQEYFKKQNGDWKTWYDQHINNQTDIAKHDAAKKAAAHAHTPSLAYLDTLGRPFLTVAHNKVDCSNHKLDGTKDKFCTRVDLDIEGNQRMVRDAVEQNGDALGRIVMCYDYDMLGNRIHQISMEAGARWMLNDIVGKPIRAWDSRGHNFTTNYDALRRPVEQTVRGTTAESDPRTLNRDILVDKIEYGEGIANADEFNLRTRIYRHLDSAGVATNARLDESGNPTEAYDFKGNLLKSTRQLVADYKAIPNWSGNPDLEREIFRSSTTYDALNRVLTSTSPDGSIHRSTFNEANLLEKVDVNLREEKNSGSEKVWTPFVSKIDYDPKGQRKRIKYGNGVKTTYDYDPLTFRLIQLKTSRGNGLNGPSAKIFNDTTIVQDLHYTYDPAGNITCIKDIALQTINRRGIIVKPFSSYTYDALYRLVEAKGREHISQTKPDYNPAGGNYRDFSFAGLADYHSHPNDLEAMRNYTERYEYDAVGNFKSLDHVGRWTRIYEYQENSLIELGKESNRLTSTNISGRKETYSSASDGYDAHGNMLRMPHLPFMQWDYRDLLQATAQQKVNGGTPETNWYVYDANGQRVRKVIESAVTEEKKAEGKKPRRMKERIYLGGFEIYREYKSDGTTPELECETLHIMDDRQRIALVETQTIKNGTQVHAPLPLQRYQLGNHLNSASLELAEDAALISYEEYHPYGTTAFQAGRSATEVSMKRYRYTGKERDEESGLYYHGARYYVPWIGRWISTDPLHSLSLPNAYEFVKNNSIIKVDPDGKEDKVPPIISGISPLQSSDRSAKLLNWSNFSRLRPGTSSIMAVLLKEYNPKALIPPIPDLKESYNLLNSTPLFNNETVIQADRPWSAERDKKYRDFQKEWDKYKQLQAKIGPVDFHAFLLVRSAEQQAKGDFIRWLNNFGTKKQSSPPVFQRGSPMHTKPSSPNRFGVPVDPTPSNALIPGKGSQQSSLLLQGHKLNDKDILGITNSQNRSVPKSETAWTPVAGKLKAIMLEEANKPKMSKSEMDDFNKFLQLENEILLRIKDWGKEIDNYSKSSRVNP